MGDTCGKCGADVLRGRYVPTGNPVTLDTLPHPQGEFELTREHRDGMALVQRRREGGYLTLHKQTCNPATKPRGEQRAPAVIVEIEACLGAAQDGTDYVDATGAQAGTTCCLECGDQVVVAYHVHRPGGEHPLLADARRLAAGPWRLYKRDAHGPVLAEFHGAGSEHAQHFNHRLICAGARVDTTTGETP